MLRHLALPALLFLVLINRSLATLPYLGHDVSSLIMLESEQKCYKNSAGQVQPLETILKNGGAKAIRMRLWVNPVEGVYNVDYNLQLARRAQAAGLAVYLDFHYSDTWADPAHQTKPAAWSSLSFSSLVSQIGPYTQQTVQAFRSGGVRLDLISIGNEIRNGLLWPDGESPNWSNAAALLKSASQGARAVTSTSSWTAPLIGIHIDNGWSLSTQTGFYDSILNTGQISLSDFDVQFVSYYPFFSNQASLANLQSSLNGMASKYGKQLIIAETNWPVECTSTSADPFPPSTSNIPFSASGQTTWVHDIINVVQSVPNGLGKGLFYWEPAWLNNTG
ncbi:glycosyl hydrolase 53 [Punctularia strigosozonata HHB-11173 SS5]|uniref:glycosyl hydrolase 53 n=1 Tax=Punctularia strigosozonata (strain HHB-11173) TaxID=741275 RepID=UPI0004416D4B|nr:glycosyl hydrolase 53 [Punctularia strigosozonata HHB-11173 SS5]EIN07971.1 glycosyl hydrolase 53 [Punctularia strigosozonata HHB-11173 SS5]